VGYVCGDYAYNWKGPIIWTDSHSGVKEGRRKKEQLADEANATHDCTRDTSGCDAAKITISKLTETAVGAK
jgi:hypothetical protein